MTTQFTTLLFLTLGFFACNRKEKATVLPKNDFILVPGQRLGPFKAAHSTENDLVQTFGAKQVKAQDFAVGEGEVINGFVLFPDTQNEVQLGYDTTYAKGKPASIRILHPKSPWKTPEGVHIGTTLEELVKINGKAITFLGFGWDYGGTLSNYNGGKLKESLFIVLAPKPDYELGENFLGDQEFSSESPDLDPKRIQVISLGTRF
jgi:hypothetical protein